jgi:hypothetical protein
MRPGTAESYDRSYKLIERSRGDAGEIVEAANRLMRKRPPECLRQGLDSGLTVRATKRTAA